MSSSVTGRPEKTRTARATPREGWPDLPLGAWRDTYETLHRWLQIVGKVRITLSPWVNHSWNATLYPTATGLTTSLIPYGLEQFQIDFDFQQHHLHVVVSDGSVQSFALQPQSVATFYRQLMHALGELGISVQIHMRPNEIPDNATRFDEDETHRAYDPEYVERFWRILVQSQRVMHEFRARFIGKCSPIHLFWGGADLAVTRFSGRAGPIHPGGIPNLPDWVTREGYSHEVSSAGFWPGNDMLPFPAFYSYAYPMPAGFGNAHVQPNEAFFSTELGEFILPYDAVRRADDPDDALLEFLQSSYEAAANLGGWDRRALERADPRLHR